MARTIWSEFTNQTGKTYRISLMETVGSPLLTQEVKADGSGFVLEYDGDEQDRFEEFSPSSVRWNFYVDNPTVETFLESVEDDEDGIYYVLIEEEVSASNYERRWLGPLELGNANWEDMSFPYAYEIVATDGVAQLGDVNFMDPLDNATMNDPDTRKYPIIDYVISSLAEITGYTDFTSGDDFLKVYLNVYEENILPGTINNNTLTHTDILGNIYIDNLAFVNIETKQKTQESVLTPSKASLSSFTRLEVLRNICRVFGLKLYFDFNSGLWTLDEVGQWRQRSTGNWLIYDTDGFPTGSDSIASVIDFNSIQPLGGGSSWFTDKYNTYTINYKHALVGLFFPNYAQYNEQTLNTTIKNYWAQEYPIGTADYGNGNNQVKFKGTFIFHFVTGYTPVALGDRFWVSFKIKYVTTEATPVTYYLSNEGGNLSWSTNSSKRVNMSSEYPYNYPKEAVRFIDLDLTTPPLPESGAFFLKVDITDVQDDCDSITIMNEGLSALESGSQIDYTEFKARKITGSNREVEYLAGEVVIGDGPFWFSPSALLWKDGNEYIQTINWIDRKQANDGNSTYYPLLSIMSQYALSAFSGNRRVMELSMRSDFGPSNILSRSGKYYRPARLTFVANSNIWSCTYNHIGSDLIDIDLGDNPVDTGRIGTTFGQGVVETPFDINVDDSGFAITGITSIDGGNANLAFNGGIDSRAGAPYYLPGYDSPASLIDDDYGNSPI